MKKKNTLIMAGQALLVIGFAYAFYNYAQSEIHPKTVYEFSQNVGVNNQITQSDLVKTSIPARAVTSGMVTDESKVLGMYVNQDVKKGRYAYQDEFVKQGSTDPFASMQTGELRKISLPINYANGLGGDLKRGDVVDLVFTGEGQKTVNGQQTTFKYSKVFLQNVLVYGVATADGYKYEDHSMQTHAEVAGASSSSGTKIDTSSSSNQLGVVTLAVKLSDVEEIEARQSAGQVNVVEHFSEGKGDPVNYKTLGYVVGDYQKVFANSSNAETSPGQINQYTQQQ